MGSYQSSQTQSFPSFPFEHFESVEAESKMEMASCASASVSAHTKRNKCRPSDTVDGLKIRRGVGRPRKDGVPNRIKPKVRKPEPAVAPKSAKAVNTKTTSSRRGRALGRHTGPLSSYNDAGDYHLYNSVEAAPGSPQDLCHTGTQLSMRAQLLEGAGTYVYSYIGYDPTQPYDDPFPSQVSGVS